MKQKLSFRPGMKALDVGAGVGKMMKVLTAEGFDTYGIEPSEPFRDRAISRMGIPADRIQLCSIEDASFEDETFDFISLGAVLEHFYDPAEVLTKCTRWLKAGGMIDMDVPSSHYLMERVINLYFRLKGTNYVSNLSPMHSPFHLYAFTREAFEALAPRAGYEIDEIKYFISPIHHFPEFIKPFFRFWMARTKQGQQLGIHLRKPKTAVVPPDGD